MQFSSEPGVDVAWTAYVLIRTSLSFDQVDSIVRAIEVEEWNEETDQSNLPEALKVWGEAIQALDPEAVVEEASYIFAPFAE